MAAVHVKIEPPDSESDYDDAHAGLDVRDESNVSTNFGGIHNVYQFFQWTPLPKHDADDLISSFDIMSLATSSETDPQMFCGSFDPPRLPLDVDPWDGRYFWTSVSPFLSSLCYSFH
jgi:hypothetical protein